MEKRKLKVKIFSTYEEEMEFEYQRRSKQSPQDRIREFSILQERCWGEKWTDEKLKYVVSYEEVNW